MSCDLCGAASSAVAAAFITRQGKGSKDSQSCSEACEDLYVASADGLLIRCVAKGLCLPRVHCCTLHKLGSSLPLARCGKAAALTLLPLTSALAFDSVTAATGA